MEKDIYGNDVFETRISDEVIHGLSEISPSGEISERANVDSKRLSSEDDILEGKLELISGMYSNKDFDEKDLQSLLDAYFSENETMPVFQTQDFNEYRPDCEENQKSLIGTITKDQFIPHPRFTWAWAIRIVRKSNYGEAALVFKNYDNPQEGLFGINFVDKLALWL